MHSIRPIYRLIALSMALLVFISSVGFAVDMHYCKGQLKSFSLLGKAKTCHELAAQTKHCKHHQKKGIVSESCDKDIKDCCENKIAHFQTDQDQHIQHFDFILNKQLEQFLNAAIVVFFLPIQREKRQSSFAHYKPPPLLRDISVLTQSFLL